MKTVGIIAEYNPFHNGHQYQIEQIKKERHADCIVAIMNGPFVQRGEPAFIDKYTRTAMALHGGVDFVFELPAYFGLSSAEDFAFGGIKMLNQLGFIDELCFGSECGSLDSLIPYAKLLAKEPEEYKSLLTSYLRSGIGFPAARELAISKILNTKNLADLKLPNNLLGVEYLKALTRTHSSITPYTITRKGGQYHDTNSDQTIPSASALRATYEKEKALPTGIPEESRKILADALIHQRPLTLNDFSDYLLYALLSQKGNYTNFKDITPDLADRIENLLSQYENPDQFARLILTKQYTLSRIRRCLCQILFTIQKDTVSSIPLRLLGMNREYSSLLKQAPEVIVKPANAKEALKKDFLINELYRQTVKNASGFDLGNEYVHSPILI